MKKTDKNQRLLSALALLVVAVAIAATPQEPSGKTNSKAPATSMPVHNAKPSETGVLGKTPKRGDVKVCYLDARVEMALVYIPGGGFLMGSPDSE